MKQIYSLGAYGICPALSRCCVRRPQRDGSSPNKILEMPRGESEGPISVAPRRAGVSPELGKRPALEGLTETAVQRAGRLPCWRMLCPPPAAGEIRRKDTRRTNEPQRGTNPGQRHRHDLPRHGTHLFRWFVLKRAADQLSCM